MVNPCPIIIIIGMPILLDKARILIKKCFKKLSRFTENNYRSLTLNKCNDVSSLVIRNSQIIKNLYREDPVVANMSQKEVKKIREANNIIEVKYMQKLYNNINDFPIPNPILTFEQAFSNYPTMLKKIREQNLEKPNSIECQAWPILLSGKDMLCIASTNLDKTLTFLLPALIHISKQNSFLNGNGPNVLILVANKMQALKIQEEVQRYSYFGIKA
ncbi:ATP-dependent RNA helicase DBP2-like [Polistes fuscatus]|uniref:ATP-dependent RNA helicase DBP2-like n=1 Tax=Polistes fuscatus TaxID=30207 RepID=UPI001CA93D2F|nr:ATP-dependent RNA helicase DBP2-like [Polistes fuscatus]